MRECKPVCTRCGHLPMYAVSICLNSFVLVRYTWNASAIGIGRTLLYYISWSFSWLLRHLLGLLNYGQAEYNSILTDIWPVNSFLSPLLCISGFYKTKWSLFCYLVLYYITGRSTGVGTFTISFFKMKQCHIKQRWRKERK